MDHRIREAMDQLDDLVRVAFRWRSVQIEPKLKSIVVLTYCEGCAKEKTDPFSRSARQRA
jgi:hypothetical protein